MRGTKLVAAAAIIVVVAGMVLDGASASALEAGDQSQVTLPNGEVLQGVVYPRSRAFLGIPYAAAPVGNLRWRPPVVNGSVVGQRGRSGAAEAPRDCTVFGYDCAQSHFFSPRSAFANQSEDCLYLNVFSPLPQSIKNGELVPVMVW